MGVYDITLVKIVNFFISSALMSHFHTKNIVIYLPIYLFYIYSMMNYF